MDNQKVVAPKNLPARLPVTPTIVAWMAMDYYESPAWLYGCLGTLLIIIWIASLVKLSRQVNTDLFEGSK